MNAPVVAATRPTRLVVLGHPIAHSRSPVFQSAALVACGIPIRYEAMDVAPDALEQTMKALGDEGAGGNVTIPHKEAVAQLARCSSLAKRIGAVNTFWHEAGVLHGHNTDVAGALASIRALCPDGVADGACTVLGAGGSAGAIVVALSMLGCTDIRLVARTPARATQLCERLNVFARVMDADDHSMADARLVVNATPVGLRDDRMPCDPSQLAPDAAVFDLVYRTGETPWVRACRARGHRAEDGQRMLLEQGAASFECWFGIEAPREVMRAALNA